MAVKQFNLPDPGEGLVEAEIVTWRVKVGDTVKVNDIVVEIETAKSLVELPVPYAGTVAALLASEGDTVAVGTPIISVDDGLGGTQAVPNGAPDQGDAEAGDAEPAGRVANLVGYGPRVTGTKRRARKGGAPAGVVAQVHQAFATVPPLAGADPALAEPPQPPAAKRVSEPVDVESVGVERVSAGAEPVGAEPVGSEGAAVEGAAVEVAGAEPVGSQTVSRSAARGREGRALAKPPVRKLAKDLGIDLTQVVGSGEGGIVRRADVEAHAAGGGAAGSTVTTPAGGDAAGAGPAYSRTREGAPSAPVFAATGEREVRIPIKGVRKMTAQAMVASAFTAPHVTEFVTVDVTRMMKLVQRLKTDREFREVSVSPLLVVAKALVIASRRNPGINATWDESAQEIVVKNYVNLGIAAATPRGLMVPNIKDADQMSLRQLADALAHLVSTAREGRTQPADMSGGSITITNVGVFGVDSGTPILNSGEAAILCFGAVRQMPWVVRGKIKPRWVTQLGVSFDHRMVDGDLGSRFLADIAAVLHDPAQALVWG
jgi:pyruvate dehydrogenase E2 component (dihydrolipoamide acetyltransferase)